MRGPSRARAEGKIQRSPVGTSQILQEQAKEEGITYQALKDRILQAAAEKWIAEKEKVKP